jgi:hypothetical protein
MSPGVAMLLAGLLVAILDPVDVSTVESQILLF